jgi:hypothetical protein
MRRKKQAETIKPGFIPRDIIGIILKSVTGKHGDFMPKRAFYIAIKIRQKRFWQLVRGEASPTTDEITAVATYFKKSMSVDIPIVQLSIFDNNETIVKAEV